MAAKGVAVCFVALFTHRLNAQVLDTEFGDGGTLIINHNVYDYGHGAVVSDNRLLVANSDWNYYSPRIDAFEADGSQDFSFGSGGDITWDTPYENGSVVYTDDAIYVGYTSHPEDFIITIHKYDLDGDPITSFGSGGVLETTVSTFDVIAWYDYFGGLSTWGDDLLFATSFMDTLVYMKVHPDGSYDEDFGNNGISKIRLQDYIGNGNYGNTNSWVTVGDTLYMSHSYYDWVTSQSFTKIIPVYQDGTVVSSAMLDVTTPGYTFIFMNEGTMYLKKSTNLHRFIGTSFTLDPTFGEDGTLYNNSGWGTNYTFGPDGSIYQHGSIGTSPMMGYCARFNANGQLDESFGDEGILTVPALVENDQVFIRNVAVNESELYLIGESGVYGTESGHADMFVTRFTDIGSHVSEEDEGHLFVYPNPVWNYLNVALPDVGQWSVTDMQGRVLLAGTSITRALNLDVSHLPVGSYILHSGAAHNQFIKQ